MVYKWDNIWDFDRAVILYAFDVTTNRITQTSQYIRYMDAILQRWKDDGLNSIDELVAYLGVSKKKILGIIHGAVMLNADECSQCTI